jgi:transcriptional regulator with XRE-family HTH domain
MRRTKFTINGPKVSEMRDERGWSMTQFAAEVGVSYGYMWRLERGERQPSPSVRKRITDALGVPLAAIVAGEPAEVA